MAMPMKPTPHKCCTTCGGQLFRKRMPNGSIESPWHFSRRKYCSRECSAAGSRGKPQKDTVNIRGYRYRARVASLQNSCSDCGKQGKLDVHHINGNPTDNSPVNLCTLCRGCHMKRHRPERICDVPNCGRKRSGHGLCDMHL